MNYRLALYSLLIALVSSGCGGPKTIDLTPRSTAATIDEIPDWYLKPPRDDDHLHAVSSATSRDMQLAIDKAKTTAQTDLAQQLGTRLGNLTRQFGEETGLEEDSQLLSQFSSATKAVADQSMSGAHVEKQQLQAERGIYRSYVLVRLPIGQANQLLMKKIKADQALHTRLRGTQAYADLDLELQQLAERKGQ